MSTKDKLLAQKDKVLDELKQKGKEAIDEVVDEIKDEILDTLRVQLIEKLTKEKEEAVSKLTNQISETKSIGVKARNALYLLVFKIFDKLIQKVLSE